ncbi:MAG: hypothetical protein IJZ74_00560 [Clostridia bacterium]|nr:hypothetical protein [Clostridia bacterium]
MTCDVRLGRVLGLPAILGERMVGHVERAVFAQDGRRLRGLIIRRGLGGAKWIGRDKISVLGDVSVILTERPARPPRDADFALRTVKDESGLTLGRVTDAWISTDTLAVTALEVTLGLLEDLRTGRRIVRQWAIRPGEDGAQVLIPREEWEVTG